MGHLHVQWRRPAWTKKMSWQSHGLSLNACVRLRHAAHLDQHLIKHAGPFLCVCGRFEPFRAKSLACEFLEMEAPLGVEIVGCTRGLGASGPPESPAALGPDAIATVLSRGHAVRAGWLKRTGDSSAEPVQVVVPGAVSQRGSGGALAAHHLAATGQLVVKRRLRRAGPVPRDEHEYRSEEMEIEPEGNAAKSPGGVRG